MTPYLLYFRKDDLEELGFGFQEEIPNQLIKAVQITAASVFVVLVIVALALSRCKK